MKQEEITTIFSYYHTLLQDYLRFSWVFSIYLANCTIDAIGQATSLGLKPKFQSAKNYKLVRLKYVSKADYRFEANNSEKRIMELKFSKL